MDNRISNDSGLHGRMEPLTVQSAKSVKPQIQRDIVEDFPLLQVVLRMNNCLCLLRKYIIYIYVYILS